MYNSANMLQRKHWMVTNLDDVAPRNLRHIATNFMGGKRLGKVRGKSLTKARATAELNAQQILVMWMKGTSDIGYLLEWG